MTMKKDDTDKKDYEQYPYDPTLTDIKDKHERASAEYWVDRVSRLGNHKSPFLDMPQEEIDVFTARHRQWVEFWVKGKDVLEIGCGYGRTMDMFRSTKTYMGLECVPSLLEEARKRYDEVFSAFDVHGGVAKSDLRIEKFDGFSFDICVAIAVISSVEPFFHDLRRRVLNALRPGGVILWCEEDYHRIDFK